MSTTCATRSSDSFDVTPASGRPVIMVKGGSVRGATFRSRISSGSRPRSFASRSRTRSRTNVSDAHGPRYAMYDALLVVTAVDSNPSAASLYGPGNIASMIPATIVPMTG
jgi:hypothetical protein